MTAAVDTSDGWWVHVAANTGVAHMVQVQLGSDGFTVCGQSVRVLGLRPRRDGEERCFTCFELVDDDRVEHCL